MADPRSSQEQPKSEAYHQAGATRQTSEQMAGATVQAREDLTNIYRESEWQTARTRQSVREGASEMAGQRDIRASGGMNDTWEQAMGYGKDHPVTTALIAFGAGIGVGLFIVAKLGGFHSRSRSSRMVPPILKLISEISREMLR